jgi:hypothetical protein
MTSRYAEKHPHEPPCSVLTCDETGIELKMYQGNLGWFCEQHLPLVEKGDRHR